MRVQTLSEPPTFFQRIVRNICAAATWSWLVVFCPLPSSAHPISLSSAVVEVQESRVQVNLEIMLEDLVLYHQLKADGNMSYAAADLQAAAKNHRQFVLDYFSILDADGNRLKGTIEEETLDQIDARGVAQSELMRRTIAFRIVYPTSLAQPAFLTFVQNFGGDRSALPALMDLYVLKGGIFIEKPSQIAYGRPHTIKIDWLAEPEGNKTTFAEIRKKREEQKRDRLGIASYTGLFSFLYITRFEVRHEILVPLLTLEQWLPIPRKNPDFLEIEEQTAIRDAVDSFFKARNTVTINDQPVEARLTRLNFFSLDINDFALNAEPRRVNVYQARVGVILSFPSREVPRKVTVQWDRFTEHAPSIHSILLIGNERPQQHYFHAADTTYRWSGQLIDRQIEAVRAEARPLAQGDRIEVLRQVFTNVYRAFDLRADDDVYDALATSVSGPLLRELYLRIKRSLVMAEQGGALAHATAVDVLTAEATRDGEADSFETTWRVTGVSEHWGHVHTRISEYRAKVTLTRRDGAWKLEKFRLLDEKRIQFETSIRGYDPG